MTLAATLQSGQILHLPGQTAHSRRGALRHAFRYGVDYLLFSPDHMAPPALLSRNGFNLFSWRDADHGGPRGQGTGADWAARVFQTAGVPQDNLCIALLTLPRFLGHWFAPVSFWLALRGDDLLAVVAEVNNTFGQRHSYLCQRPDRAPIGPADAITTEKLFHVSPFQDVSGRYDFGFSLSPDRIAIRIRQIDGDKGLNAALCGPLKPLTTAGLAAAALRRPGGSLRIVGLIFWHALRLRLKGAAYRPLPPLPEQDLS